MDHITADLPLVILSTLKIITLAIGTTFVVYAGRAWLKHRTRSMLLLAVAIAILTGGIFVEGVVFWATGSMEAAHITEASIALIGFSVLLGSIMVSRKGQTRRVPVARVDDTARGKSTKDDE
jgi:hypothetical protein